MCRPAAVTIATLVALVQPDDYFVGDLLRPELPSVLKCVGHALDCGSFEEECNVFEMLHFGTVKAFLSFAFLCHFQSRYSGYKL